MPSKLTQIIGLAGWLFLSLIIAAIGAAASIQAASFYEQLNQPSWAPPAHVFGPVWSFLYILMGLSAWLVWRTKENNSTRLPLTLFLIQLGFNALWSWLFFWWHLGALAFVDIVILWLLIALTLFAFLRQNKLAGLLLIPYLLWVTFAAILNFAIWQLNSQLLH